MEVNYSYNYKAAFNDRLKKGQKIEHYFAKVITTNYPQLIAQSATTSDNIYKHYDYSFTHTPTEKEFLVDVKRQSATLPPEYTPLELFNDYGYHGWLLTASGNTHYFAFEKPTFFWIIKATVLRDWTLSYYKRSCIPNKLLPIYYTTKDTITTNRNFPDKSAELSLVHDSDLIKLGAKKVFK